MSRYCICVVMGLPGSGKTTTCRFFIDTSHTEVGDKNTEILYFSYDELAKKFKATEGTYKTFRNKAIDYVENNLKKILNINDRKFVLLIDDIMYYSSMRKQVFNLCRKYEISYCQVYMNCDYSIAINRNTFRKGEDRFDRVLPESIFHMSLKLEPPSKEPWEKFTFTLPSRTPTNTCFAEVMWDTIKSAMLCPFKNDSTNEKTVQDTASEVHQVDLIVRRYISEKMALMREDNVDNISVLGKTLSARKKEFLEEVKFGNICLEEPYGDDLVRDIFHDFCTKHMDKPIEIN